MKYLKKNVLVIASLTLLDQLIKLLIRFNCMEHKITIIPNAVYFRPLQNKNLSWVGNFMNVFSNPIVLFSFNIIAFFGVILLFDYFWKAMGPAGKLSRLAFVAGMAGIICSFIDKLTGGSIDYIMLERLFVFDLKDCYLTTMEVLIVLGAIRYRKEISHLKLKDLIRFYRDEKENKKSNDMEG